MNAPQNQTIATIELVITGETLVPDHITTTLGLAPTRSFMKDDLVSQRTGTKRPWGLWGLEFQGTDVQENAVRLLEALRGKEAAIRTFIDTPGVHVAIAIWWEPEGGQGGFTVESATFAQLCALGTNIHVYFPGYQEPAHQQRQAT